MYYVMGDIAEKPKHYDPMSEALMLWRRAELPEKQTRYGLTAFATTLNEITPGLRVSIWVFVALSQFSSFFMAEMHIL
jgi:hypothetical protein